MTAIPADLVRAMRTVVGFADDIGREGAIGLADAADVMRRHLERHDSRPKRTVGASKRAGWENAKQAVRKRSRGRCEARVSEHCTGVHEHTHHRLMRSHGGTDDLANLLAVCHCCHREIHEHPADAYAAGHLVRGVS